MAASDEAPRPRSPNSSAVQGLGDMRSVAVPLVLCLSLFGPGCALLQDATRDLCVSFSEPLEEMRERSRNRQWAEAAWQQVCATEGTADHSDDFATGFKDGYAEYLFRGGDGEPPMTPPLHYRHFSYQTPDGYAAISDWFAGYRHGTAAAKASGAREWITGPSSLRAGTDVPQLNGQQEIAPVPPSPSKVALPPTGPSAAPQSPDLIQPVGWRIAPATADLFNPVRVEPRVMVPAPAAPTNAAGGGVSPTVWGISKKP
jgi:hypothetical protein